MNLVSVVMPAYNAEKYISKAIDSILSQTYRNLELVICDDCSSDSTLAIIQAYASKDKRIKVFHNITNQGYLKTWNYLVPKAIGEYITFQDADDYCTADRIEILLNTLLNDSSIDVVGSDIALIGEDSKIIKVMNYPTEWVEIQSQLMEKYSFPFCGSAVMIRKKVFEVIGGYRVFFDRLGWEDHDWLIRICEKFKAKSISKVLYLYKDNPNSVTRSLMPKEIRKLFIKDIGLELAKQRATYGFDCLMSDNQEELQKIIIKYEKPYLDNPALVFQLLAARHLTKEDPLFWDYLKRSIANAPFSLRNIKLLIKRLIS